MEKEIERICNKFVIKQIGEVNYDCGYPVITFECNEKMNNKKISDRKIKSIVRNAEIATGTKLGVGLNLLRTSYAKINDSTITICGHILLIEYVLDKILNR